MRGLVSEKSAGPRDDVLGAMVASVVTNLGGGRALVENVTNDGVAGSCFKIKLTTSRGLSWLKTMPLNERERIWPGKTCRLSELPWDGSEPLPYKILHRKELWEPEPVENSPFTSSRVQRVAEWVDWNPKDGAQEIRAKLASLQTKLEGVYHLTDHAAMPEKRTLNEQGRSLLIGGEAFAYSPLKLLHEGRFVNSQYSGVNGSFHVTSVGENQTSLEMLTNNGSAEYTTHGKRYEMQWRAEWLKGKVRLIASVHSGEFQRIQEAPYYRSKTNEVSFEWNEKCSEPWQANLDAFYVKIADLEQKVIDLEDQSALKRENWNVEQLTSDSSPFSLVSFADKSQAGEI